MVDALTISGTSAMFSRMGAKGNECPKGGFSDRGSASPEGVDRPLRIGFSPLDEDVRCLVT